MPAIIFYNSFVNTLKLNTFVHINVYSMFLLCKLLFEFLLINKSPMHNVDFQKINMIYH